MIFYIVRITNNKKNSSFMGTFKEENEAIEFLNNSLSYNELVEEAENVKVYVSNKENYTGYAEVITAYANV